MPPRVPAGPQHGQLPPALRASSSSSHGNSRALSQQFEPHAIGFSHTHPLPAPPPGACSLPPSPAAGTCWSPHRGASALLPTAESSSTNPSNKASSPEPYKGLHSPCSLAYHAEDRGKKNPNKRRHSIQRREGSSVGQMGLGMSDFHSTFNSAHPSTTWPGGNPLAQCLHPRSFPSLFGAGTQVPHFKTVVENCCEKKKQQLMISREKTLQQDLKLNRVRGQSVRRRRKSHVWQSPALGAEHDKAPFPELEQGCLKLGVKTFHPLKPSKSIHGF